MGTLCICKDSTDIRFIFFKQLFDGMILNLWIQKQTVRIEDIAIIWLYLK